MNRLLLAVGFLICLPLFGQAQEIRTNEKGEKIIVYSDGSWRYFNSNDNTLFGSDGQVHEQELIPTDPKEREAYLEEKEREKAVLLANQAAIELSRFEDKYNQLRKARLSIEEELAEMKKLGGSKQSIDDLKGDLDQAKEKEETAREEMEIAGDLAELAEEMIEMKRKKRAKSMDDFEEQYTLLHGAPTVNEPVETEVTETTGEQVYSLNPGRFAKYDPDLDVSINPPKPKCRLQFDGVDEFSGKQRRDTEMELFFTYTRDELRPYLKGKEYVVCEGQLTTLSGGLLFLSLEFTIASKTAQQSFGGLQKGSLLTIKLMSGESVRLVNSKTDFGSFNAVDETFTFRGQFMIDPSQEKMLNNGEVDKVRVNWGAGYEDYEVFRLDFFRDHLRCLYED
ncbi:MAG: hypothetical protein GYB31_04925 [Bacteroidetes bacterium]|nr:hypothetical protein [Bacteroidota bacterium]